MTDAVRFDEVTFTYPDADIPALRDVNLHVPPGNFVLVTGPTGSGKSTLLRAINGLVPHFTGGTFRGRVQVGGRDTVDHAPRQLASTVAFVPQDPDASFVVDRVEDELAYAMENLGTPPATMRRRVEEMLDLLALADLRTRSVRTLSGGERQRVAIAAALTPGARVLVMDEPTSQLDPQGAEDVLAALQRLVHDLGMTVVVAEHRLERVAGFADLAVACSGGRVTLGSPREIFESGASGPPVARLGRLLGWTPIPLTVRDARRLNDGRIGGLTPPKPQTSLDGDEIISVHRVTAAYGDRTALRDVELHVTRGEIVAVVGRNGAGKTTLLRCIAGLHAPATGTISVSGAPPVIARSVAYCPQAPDVVLFRDRVDDEIAATARAHELSPDLMAELGLEEIAARHPRDLSAGQRALVAVAAISATGAPVLLLDEPTRGLDPASKERLVRYATQRAKVGTVIVATHDVELAAALATRVVMLAAGSVVADGTPAEVLGDSPVFAPQTARVLGPRWLTPEQVAAAL